MNLNKLILSILFSSFLIVTNVSFANEKSPKGTIKRLVAYSLYSAGDMLVSLQTNGSVCSNGYFIDKNTIGYENILSMLLSAYHAKTPIYITGDEGNKWGGSSKPTCHILSVEYIT